MTFEQWLEGHQVVMTAFGKHLPEGATSLATMARSLAYSKVSKISLTLSIMDRC
jgi:hypothetical protein